MKEKAVYIDNVRYMSVMPEMISSSMPAPYRILVDPNSGYSELQRAFDRNPTTYIRSSININPIKAWVTVDLGSVKRVDLITIMSTTYTAKTFKIQGSNDNINFVDLCDDIVNKTDWQQNTEYPFKLTNSGYYRFYRIYPLEKNGDNSISFQEITLYQYAPQKVVFYKTETRLMPDEVQDRNVTEVHFTDQGEIFVSDNIGKFKRMSGSDFGVIKEQNEILEQEFEKVSNILDILNGEVIE